MVSIHRKQTLTRASATSRCLLVGLTAAALLAAACGSADSSFTNRSNGPASNNTGGAPFGGAQGLSGAPFGNGGMPIGAGGIVLSNGGSSIGGFVQSSGGAGGFGQSSGGADASAPSSGGSGQGTGGTQDAGQMVNPFPSGFGFLISQACSDCASMNCQAEERVCAADPACVAVGQCIATCLGPTCLACITTLSNQTAYNEFVAVTKCTDQKCQPTCPFLNIGGGGTNP
jgi:hypothetical protein